MRLGVLRPARIDDAALALLNKRFTVKPVEPGSMEFERCEVLWVGLEPYMGRQLLEQARGLRVVATPTTGHTHLDTQYLRERGVAVVSFRDRTDLLENVRATAEHTMALLLALMRKIPAAHRAATIGIRERARFCGAEIFGKQAGVVGYGRLGRIVARYLQAFGARVLAHDPAVHAGDVPMVGLMELLQTSDVVTVHASLNSDNHKLIGREQLRRMKRSAFLVNTARGELIDEQALLEALREGWIAGAALDVLANEHMPRGEDDPLIAYARSADNLILTPHIGGMTSESRVKTDVLLAEILCSMIEEWDPPAGNDRAGPPNLATNRARSC